MSDESVSDGLVNLADYTFVDLICGEEKETEWPKEYSDSLLGKQFKIFTDEFRSVIGSYLFAGGNIFISGSYIGSDLYLGKPKDDPGVLYAQDTLKYKLDADHAVRNGAVFSIDQDFFPQDITIEFNTSLSEDVYSVEAPDAIGAINGSKTLLRYTENRFSAGIGYKNQYGIIAIGFPFETIIPENTRTQLMKSILTYLIN